MLPGISTEDCLYADLGVDPGLIGSQNFEATDFIVSGRKRRSREEIQRLMMEFESSGLRQNEFCRRHGLALSTLQRQLKKRRLDRMCPEIYLVRGGVAH